MTTGDLAEIKQRVNAQPGEETFDPAYFWSKNTHADAVALIQALEDSWAERDRYREALEAIFIRTPSDGAVTLPIAISLAQEALQAVKESG